MTLFTASLQQPLHYEIARHSLQVARLPILIAAIALHCPRSTKLRRGEFVAANRRCQLQEQQLTLVIAELERSLINGFS